MTEIIAYFQNQIRLNKTYIEREYNREKHVDYQSIQAYQHENARFERFIQELENKPVGSDGRVIGVQDHAVRMVNHD